MYMTCHLGRSFKKYFFPQNSELATYEVSYYYKDILFLANFLSQPKSYAFRYIKMIFLDTKNLSDEL